MQDFIAIEKMSELRKSAGQSDKRVAQAAQEFFTIPESGVFGAITTKEFDIPNVGKRTSVGIECTTGQIVGFISENTLNAQELLNELTEIKNGTRKGKFMLRGVRLSDLSKFGSSADMRLINLQGKKFSTVKKDIRVYKAEYLDAEKFDGVCIDKSNAANLKNCLEKTETKGGYIFEVA